MVTSISLAQFPIVSAHIGDMLEENKLVKFAKETAKTHLVIRIHGPLQDIRFGMIGSPSGEGLGGFGAEPGQFQ